MSRIENQTIIHPRISVNMSSNKRRKLEVQAAPQPAVSAVSALAARRRLAANTATREASASPEPEETPPARTNAFSVLQTLKRQNDPSKSPVKGGTKGTPNRSDIKRSATPGTFNKQSSGTEKSTPEAGSSTPQRVTYTSFLLSKHNCRTTSNGAVGLRLKDSERFLVLGSFGIRVQTGEVTVSGATLRPSDKIHWIHAPHCYAIPVLRTSEKTTLELHNDLTADGLRKLSRLSPLFRRIWNESDPEARGAKLGAGQTFQILFNSDDAPKKSVIQELSSPPEWNRKLASLVAAEGGPQTTLVCGPKSAGKSTFSRLLANRLLANDSSTTARKGMHGVAILDLDPGQPEYTPCGTLSLVHITQPNLSAPFTHTSLHDDTYRVVRCHALASVTPASAPDHYLGSALDLLDTYRRTLRNCHLLINTPGWILGTGLDLLAEIITRINPTEVVYMSEDGPSETVEVLRAATKRTFTTLPSQSCEFASRTAAHLRAMQTMSYLHLADEKSADPNGRPSWNPSPLSSLPPWQIRYSGSRSGILGILSYDYQSPPALLAETINGMILAAVDIEDPRAFHGLIEGSSAPGATADAMDTSRDEDAAVLGGLVSRTAEGLPYIPNPNDIALDPRYSRTIGLVLVRGIDTASRCLQVLTPIPPKKIDEIKTQGRHIVLVHGKFDTPTWAYTEDLYERSGQEDDGAEPQMEVANEDASEDEEDGDGGDDEAAGLQQPVENAGSVTALPWVEVLRGNQKRPVGSRVWRVRRDLGRNTGGGLI